MKSFVPYLDRLLYPGFQDRWDHTLFRELVLGKLAPTHRILDLGAGAGIIEQVRFRGHAAQVCGVDLDNRVLQNPGLDDARVGDAGRIPYEDEAFDLVFCNNVLEHLEKPAVVFQEVWRVLKPGGLFVAKTPNKWHYVPGIATCTPHWFHELVNGWRGRDHQDTFPTRYRANSSRQVKSLAAATGFDMQQLFLIEGRPEYLRLTSMTYLLGWIYERIVNSWSGLSFLRGVLICVLQKNPSCCGERRLRAAATNETKIAAAA